MKKNKKMNTGDISKLLFRLPLIGFFIISCTPIISILLQRNHKPTIRIIPNNALVRLCH